MIESVGVFFLNQCKLKDRKKASLDQYLKKLVRTPRWMQQNLRPFSFFFLLMELFFYNFDLFQVEYL